MSERPDPDRILAFAAEHGYVLFPWQEDLIRAVCAGDRIVAVPSKRNGVGTLRRVIREYSSEHPHPDLTENHGMSLPLT